ncbi:hypothetical protein F2Q69_00021909 [Brassica cretica]|uniref:Uncharacterized protein n=1 Tax=Brassica cretica TaxID=69181 RepID=A0A8S9QAA6_BRACR|nr:hypothetical protein F2Q69_00021909 [Brassica cretica]
MIKTRLLRSSNLISDSFTPDYFGKLVNGKINEPLSYAVFKNVTTPQGFLDRGLWRYTGELHGGYGWRCEGIVARTYEAVTVRRYLLGYFRWNDPRKHSERKEVSDNSDEPRPSEYSEKPLPSEYSEEVYPSGYSEEICPRNIPRKLSELTSLVEKRFRFPQDSVELYVENANRGLCAIAQAESLRYKLLGGLAVCSPSVLFFWSQLQAFLGSCPSVKIAFLVVMI